MKCLKVEMVGRGEVLVDMDPPLTKDKERHKDKCADGSEEVLKEKAPHC